MDCQVVKDSLIPRATFEEIPEDLKDAAVMVLLQKRQDDWYFILITRAESLSLHGGEIAFPGGRREAVDGKPEDTALRELAEEIGVPAERVTVLGTIPFVMTLGSGYAIVPIVGILDESFRSFKLQVEEVQEVLVVPVSLFNEPSVTLGPDHYFLKGHYFKGRVIWGATWKIIMKFLETVNFP